MTREFRLLPASALFLALALVACGGGDGEATTTQGDTTPTTAPSDSTTTTEADSQGEAPDPAGDYMVTHYYSPEFNGATNLWPDTEITLTLGADGTLSGNAGCNDYSGTWEVSGPYVSDVGFDNELGQTFTISDLTWTEMACEDELLMEQEAEFLQALGEVDHWIFGEGFGGVAEALLLTSLGQGLRVQGVPGG